MSEPTGQLRITYEESLAIAIVRFMSVLWKKGDVRVTLPVPSDDNASATYVSISRDTRDYGVKYEMKLGPTLIFVFTITFGTTEFSGVQRGTPFIRIELLQSPPTENLMVLLVAFLENETGLTIGETTHPVDSLDSLAAVFGSKE